MFSFFFPNDDLISEAGTIVVTGSDHVMMYGECTAPLVRIRTRKSKVDWIDIDLQSLMKSRNYYRREYQTSRIPEHWHRYKALRAEVNHKVRQAKAKHYSDVCQNLKTHPSQSW